MGNCAEMCADKYTFTLGWDAFALDPTSAPRARWKQAVEAELAAVSVPQRKGDPIVVDKDEEPLVPTRQDGQASPSI